MSQRMGVGFVGCGGFASGNHIPNVSKNPAFEIVGFCDLNEKHLAELQTQYKPRYVTTDMRKLIADPAVEMIVCSTKPDARIPVMELAAQHRKALFVEKPMCYREDEIAGMVSLIRSSGIPFMVGYNRPYSPLMRDLKPIFQRWRKGNTTIIYRIIGEADLWPKHHYDAVVIRKESTILHEATHIFDLLNWLTDAAPTRVYTAGGGNMDNIITLTYPDDTTAVVISGDNGNAGFPKERIEVDTNFNVIVGNDFAELRTVDANGVLARKTYEYKMAGAPYNTPFVETTAKLAAWRASVTEAERATGYYYDRQVKVEKGHANELEAFRRVIRGEAATETGVERGALANLIAWRAVESWETGKPVDLDFSGLYA